MYSFSNKKGIKTTYFLFQPFQYRQCSLILPKSYKPWLKTNILYRLWDPVPQNDLYQLGRRLCIDNFRYHPSDTLKTIYNWLALLVITLILVMCFSVEKGADCCNGKYVYRISITRLTSLGCRALGSCRFFLTLFLQLLPIEPLFLGL